MIARPHHLHPLQRTRKTVGSHTDRVRPDSSRRNQGAGNFKELRCKLAMSLIIVEFVSSLLKIFAHTRVGQRVFMLDVFTGEFNDYDGAVSSARFCRQSIGAYLGCCRIGDGVPGEAEFVLGVLVDLFAAFGVFVVKDFFSA